MPSRTSSSQLLFDNLPRVHSAFSFTMSVGLWGSMQTHGSKPLPGVFLCNHEVPSQCPSVTLLTRPSEARVNQSSHYIVYPVTGLSHATIPLFSLNQCLSSLGLLGPILASTCCSTRYTTLDFSPYVSNRRSRKSISVTAPEMSVSP